MNLEDMLKGSGAIAAIGLAAATAAGVGMLVTRHPETARRGVRILMHGAQRLGLALAQTREELGDLWAEAREELREDLDLIEVRRAAESWASGAARTPPSEPAPRAVPRTRAKARKKTASKAAPARKSARARTRARVPA